MLLRFRASLRQEDLNDEAGAAVDLKRLHDLSPSDQALTKELSRLLTALGDHRGMIELYEDQILRGREPHVRAELARKVARIWESDIGDAREAADAWRRVLRMKAGDKEAVAGLERAKSGKLKMAPPVRKSVAPPPPPPSIAPPSVTKAPAPEELAVVADVDQGFDADAEFADITAEIPAMDLEATAALLGASGGDQQDAAAYAGSMAEPADMASGPAAIAFDAPPVIGSPEAPAMPPPVGSPMAAAAYDDAQGGYPAAVAPAVVAPPGPPPMVDPLPPAVDAYGHPVGPPAAVTGPPPMVHAAIGQPPAGAPAMVPATYDPNTGQMIQAPPVVAPPVIENPDEPVDLDIEDLSDDIEFIEVMDEP
jgi:hypothetical protein